MWVHPMNSSNVLVNHCNLLLLTNCKMHGCLCWSLPYFPVWGLELLPILCKGCPGHLILLPPLLGPLQIFLFNSKVFLAAAYMQPAVCNLSKATCWITERVCMQSSRALSVERCFLERWAQSTEISVNSMRRFSSFCWDAPLYWVGLIGL